MARQNVAKLFRVAQQDQRLRKELSEAPDLETFVQRANTHGFHFTIEEWREMTGFSVEEEEGELSEIPGI